MSQNTNNKACWPEERIRAVAIRMAERIAKNAGVAEQLCFPHAYLTLKDELSAPAAPAVDAAKLTEDEQTALLVKIESYMEVVDYTGSQSHPNSNAAEAAIYEHVAALIAKRAPALPVDAADLGKLKALAEAAKQSDAPYFPNAVLDLLSLVAQQAARIAASESLLKAAKVYAFNYLQDERDEPELCGYGPKHHAEIVELWEAIEAQEGK